MWDEGWFPVALWDCGSSSGVDSLLMATGDRCLGSLSLAFQTSLTLSQLKWKHSMWPRLPAFCLPDTCINIWVLVSHEHHMTSHDYHMTITWPPHDITWPSHVDVMSCEGDVIRVSFPCCCVWGTRLIIPVHAESQWPYNQTSSGTASACLSSWETDSLERWAIVYSICS